MNIAYILVIYAAVILGLAWAVICTVMIMKVKLTDDQDSFTDSKPEAEEEDNTFMYPNKLAMVESIGLKIEKGAYAFLLQEYCIMSVFVVGFGVVVLVVVDFFGTGGGFKPQFYAFIAFVIGSITSMVCGWIGMAIAVKSNYRTTFVAT